MDYPIISAAPSVQRTYEAMRARGESHRLAEMLATGTPPMSNTDREFLEGHCNGSQFANEEEIGEVYRRRARAAGVDPKGKVYLSGLARFPGDPEAWVDGRGDVQRRLEERGWGSEGSVTVKPRDPVAPSPSPKVADDLVDDEVGRILAAVPPAERAAVDTQDLREQVVAARAPHWSN